MSVSTYTHTDTSVDTYRYFTSIVTDPAEGSSVILCSGRTILIPWLALSLSKSITASPRQHMLSVKHVTLITHHTVDSFPYDAHYIQRR